ncbi:MAG: CcoQ/FixQ family Cbb3-type cytochrome c oxidase assembly chaperone [Desulfuromonas sp.]|nr:MAG: CcoQ/FixQ family Cbb3-type cytochrome c oxidase assembly chaperone [Desulfuromonas sp.]
MDWGALLYLGTTFGLFAIFVVIVARTYRRSHKDKHEAPKFRMLDDD